MFYFQKSHCRLQDNHHQLLILAYPKFFYFIYCTLSMRQKTKNIRNQGSNDKKIYFLVQSLSHIPRWVRLVQKTRAKNSNAWVPLKVLKCENFHRMHFLYFYTIKPIWVGDFRAKIKN